MADLLDQKAALLAASQKMKQQAAQELAATNIETQQPAVVAPSEPEPAKPVATAELEKEVKESQQPTQETKPPSDEKPEAPELGTSWDDTPQATTPDVNFEKIGSALKLEGIKSESELVAKFTEINTKLAQYEEKEKTISNVPEELKEVLSIAAKGGDWKSYFNPIDFSKVDPVALYELEVAKLPQFRNGDGSFNQAKFDEVLDTIPENQKELEGSRIAQQRIYEQQHFRQQQQAIAQQRREAQDRELSEAVKDLSKLFPVEQYGIKFDNKHSEYLYKGMSDKSLLQKHLLKSDGTFDAKKLTATIAKAEYGEKMMKSIASQSKVAAKKEILQATTNPQLSTSSQSVAPQQVDEKPLSPAEKLMKHYSKSQVTGHL